MDHELMNLDILIDNAGENGDLTDDEWDGLLHELNDIRQNIRRIIIQIRLRLRRRT